MKTLLKQWAPGLFGALAKVKHDLEFRWALRNQTRSMRRLDALVLDELNAQVAHGPFRGLRYLRDCAGVSCKVLGTYERELSPLLESLLEVPYDAVLNIGCAEGYYAVGWAYRRGDGEVYAYDIDTSAQRLAGQLAKLNGVAHRVHVAGECDHSELERFRGRRVLVICDIEGAELGLLDPQKAPALAGYDLLVELHDGAGSTQIKDALDARFGQTHKATYYRYEGRSEADCPPLRTLPTPELRFQAVDERRGVGLEWVMYRARANGVG